MDNVTFIDSAGWHARRRASQRQVPRRSAALCTSAEFQEVLQITKLLTVFDVFNTEAEAVRSFSK